MIKRQKADYEEISRQLGSLVSPTIEAALYEVDDIIDATELSVGVLRNLSGATRELGKSLKSINLAIVACQQELGNKAGVR